jgi:hypothetical protein
MRSHRHSRNSIPFHNSRRQRSWANSWRPGSHSRSKRRAVPAGRPFSLPEECRRVARDRMIACRRFTTPAKSDVHSSARPHLDNAPKRFVAMDSACGPESWKRAAEGENLTVVRRGRYRLRFQQPGRVPLSPKIAQGTGRTVRRGIRSLGHETGDLRSCVFQDKGIDTDTRRRVLHEQASASAFKSFRDSL